MNKHTTTIHGKCPLNGRWDYYTLTVTTDDFLRVEELEEICDFVRGKAMSQEEIADELSRTLPPHCTIEMTGRHCQNCQTVTARSFAR